MYDSYLPYLRYQSFARNRLFLSWAKTIREKVKKAMAGQPKSVTLEQAREQIKRSHKPDNRQNKGYEGISRPIARGEN